MKEILLLILMTMIPALELRASIPYGIIETDLHWTAVFLVCVAANILLGPLVYLFLDKAIHIFLKIKIIENIYRHYVEKTQKKARKYVEKYGEIGIAVFIGIPLPGSGSYTGALAAYLLGLGYKKFIVANIIGVLIAGTVVTAVVLSGSQLFSIFVG